MEKEVMPELLGSYSGVTPMAIGLSIPVDEGRI
jgi:hypothetical protein